MPHNRNGVYYASKKCIVLSLHDFREVDANGDVGNVVANGGLLASDTTPILRADAAESEEIAWAAANQDPIAAQVAIPEDFDGGENVEVELGVLTDNSGGGGIEAASFTVETSWDGGALVSDACTDAVPATSYHVNSAVVAAADIPDEPKRLTLALTPGTHANDPTALQSVRIWYVPKRFESRP